MGVGVGVGVTLNSGKRRSVEERSWEKLGGADRRRGVPCLVWRAACGGERLRLTDASNESRNGDHLAGEEGEGEEALVAEGADDVVGSFARGEHLGHEHVGDETLEGDLDGPVLVTEEHEEEYGRLDHDDS